MLGITPAAVLAAAFFSYAVEALPARPQHYYYHSPPAWKYSTPHMDATTSFPTFSYDGTAVSPSRTAPYGYSASAFSPVYAPLTDISGSDYPMPTGSSYPMPSDSGYPMSIGSGYPFPSHSASHRHHHHRSSDVTQILAPTATETPPIASDNPTMASPSATATVTGAPIPDTIRGVNIGNWLVLERWMDEENLFSGAFAGATDQWSFDSIPGAAQELQRHWDSYFTEDDVKKIASWGVNALRIPIGYWAYDNSGTPYVTGADANLEKAVVWARDAGLKVLVDCHGSPGSQNGYEHSGRSGAVSWQTEDNLDKSITILETMAKKYGAVKYADVVYAIELVNEPISWDQNNFTTTKEWAQKAYTAVRAAATNKDLIVVMHDGFMGPSQWTDVGEAVNSNLSIADAKFAIDTHLYQNQDSMDKTLTQAQHIAKACNWTSSAFLPPTSQLPVYVGELSAATDICANPDGSTVPGTMCTQNGCQCADNVPVQNWNQPLIQATRKFVEAEMDAFEHGSKGWFMWSYKGPGAWGLSNAVRYGLVGSKVTDRMFPGQCNF